MPEQPDSSVYLNGEGSVLVVLPARQSEAAELSSLPVIIHEEIEDRIASAIGYIDRVLSHVDPT